MINIKNKKINNLKISQKIIIVLISSMLICASLWTVVMFINMRRNAEDNALQSEKTYISNFSSKSTSIEEVCGLAEAAVASSSSINNYISSVKYNKKITGKMQKNFYSTDYFMLNNMSEINHYLYRVRLYVNGKIVEKPPIYYNINKIKKMDWEKTYRSDEWQLDYIDKVSSDYSTTPLLGIISKIKDDNGKLLGVIEVSTKMEELFPDIYNNNGDEWSCFISNDDKIYSSDKNRDIWKKNKKLLTEYTKQDKYFNNSFCAMFNNTECTVSSYYMLDLKGTYIHIKSMKSTISTYYESQIPYILVVIVSSIIFIFIVFVLIKRIFKRFNLLIDEVGKIKRKEYLIIPETGNDEITQLSRQINSMLASINQLNIENTNKQLLAKNAEIKTLQNQINAHFMYNVLETIKMMAEIKEEFEISDAITSLGQMFRYSMKWTSGLVELREEINYIKNYLNLLNLRFDYEIFLSLSIDEDFMDLKIPKMSLQPLIENSVYHGIENIAQDTFIYIKVFKKDGIINLEVSDAGAGMDIETLNKLRTSIDDIYEINDEKEHGRALYNVQQRIKMHFGQEYGLKIYSEKNVYTKVLIQIPEREENK